MRVGIPLDFGSFHLIVVYLSLGVPAAKQAVASSIRNVLSIGVEKQADGSGDAAADA